MISIGCALLPLACAVSYAGNALLTRHVGPKEGPWTSMLLAALFGTLVTSLALPFFWSPIALADLPVFLLLGVLGSGAQLCIIRSFSTTEAAVVAAPDDERGSVVRAVVVLPR